MPVQASNIWEIAITGMGCTGGVHVDSGVSLVLHLVIKIASRITHRLIVVAIVVKIQMRVMKEQNSARTVKFRYSSYTTIFIVFAFSL